MHYFSCLHTDVNILLSVRPYFIAWRFLLDLVLLSLSMIGPSSINKMNLFCCFALLIFHTQIFYLYMSLFSHPVLSLCFINLFLFTYLLCPCDKF